MRILTISDLHAPYHHPQALAFLRALAKQYKPHVIVCLGDEIDSHCWSKWGKATKAHGSHDELRTAREAMQRLRKMLGSEILFCNSNHVDRAAKRLEESGVPADFLRPIPEVLGAPAGWKWADWHEVDGVVYEHGEGYSGQYAAITAATDNRACTVIGHLHGYAGVQWRQSKRSALWGMFAGCLLDPKSPAFGYGKHSRFKPLIGTGVVLDGVPHWIPL